MTPENSLSVGCLLSQQTSAIHKKLSYLPAQFAKGSQPTPHLSPLPASGARREKRAELVDSILNQRWQHRNQQLASPLGKGEDEGERLDEHDSQS